MSYILVTMVTMHSPVLKLFIFHLPVSVAFIFPSSGVQAFIFSSHVSRTFFYFHSPTEKTLIFYLPVVGTIISPLDFHMRCCHLFQWWLYTLVLDWPVSSCHLSSLSSLSASPCTRYSYCCSWRHSKVTMPKRVSYPKQHIRFSDMI